MKARTTLPVPPRGIDLSLARDFKNGSGPMAMFLVEAVLLTVLVHQGGRPIGLVEDTDL